MAGLPSQGTSLALESLKQLPALDHPILGSSLAASVTRDLPPDFAKKNAALLSALSSTFGSVREILLPAKFPAMAHPSRIVIHIQDVHQNEAAQKNIGQAVQALVDQNQAGFIALEGSFRPIDLSDLRSFSRQDVLHKWVNYLLHTN
jgi:hypothetical protein